MTTGTRVVALISVCSVLSTPAGAQPQNVAMIPTVFDEGTHEIPRVLFDEGLLAAAHELVDGEVIGPSDIEAMLDFEKQKDLAGCEEISCFAEMGGALGMAHIISWRIARVEGEWVVSGKLIDVHHAVVTARVSQFVAGDVKSLMVASKALIERLLLPQEATVSSGMTASNPMRPPERERRPWVTLGVPRDTWIRYDVYARAAEDAGLAPASFESWQKEVRPRKAAWWAYLAAYQDRRIPDELSFTQWYAESWLGTLDVTTSTPGAAVYIDDELRGTTPLELELRGKHRVALFLDGHVPVAESVTVIGGSTYELTRQLEPEQAFLKRQAVVNETRTSRRIGGWASMGSAAAMAITGAVLIGVAFGPVRDEIEQDYELVDAATNHYALDESYARVEEGIRTHNILVAIAAVAFSAGAVLAGLGGYLFASRPPTLETVVVVEPTVGGGLFRIRLDL